MSLATCMPLGQDWILPLENQTISLMVLDSFWEKLWLLFWCSLDFITQVLSGLQSAVSMAVFEVVTVGWVLVYRRASVSWPCLCTCTEMSVISKLSKVFWGVCMNGYALKKMRDYLWRGWYLINCSITALTWTIYVYFLTFFLNMKYNNLYEISSMNFISFFFMYFIIFQPISYHLSIQKVE